MNIEMHELTAMLAEERRLERLRVYKEILERANFRGVDTTSGRPDWPNKYIDIREHVLKDICGVEDDE